MNGSEYLLDTNVVIDLLTEDEPVSSFFRSSIPPESVFAISQITRMELLSLPGISPVAEQRIRRFLADVFVIPINIPIEEQAIRLRREQRLKLPDAIIASTAIVQGAVFITSDKKLIESMPPGIQVTIPRE